LIKIANYNAIHHDNKRLSEEEFDYTTYIEVDDNKPIIVNVMGRLHLPNFDITQTVFNFGECPVNENRDIKFSIKNRSIIPLNFKFDKYMYFNINP